MRRELKQRLNWVSTLDTSSVKDILFWWRGSDQDQDGKKKKRCQLTEDIMHEAKLYLWDVINPIESNEARMTQGAWISHVWLSSIDQQPHGDFATIPDLLALPFISLMGLCNLSPKWPLLQKLVCAARSRLPFTCCKRELSGVADAWPLLFVGKLVEHGKNSAKYASYYSWPNQFQLNKTSEKKKLL